MCRPVIIFAVRQTVTVDFDQGSIFYLSLSHHCQRLVISGLVGAEPVPKRTGGQPGEGAYRVVDAT